MGRQWDGELGCHVRPCLPAPSQPALLPLFLGEGLAPHGHVLLVLHQPQQGRAGLDAQAIVVVLGVAPGREAEGEGWAGGGPRSSTGNFTSHPRSLC